MQEVRHVAGRVLKRYERRWKLGRDCEDQAVQFGGVSLQVARGSQRAGMANDTLGFNQVVSGRRVDSGHESLPQRVGADARRIDAASSTSGHQNAERA